MRPTSSTLLVLLCAAFAVQRAAAAILNVNEPPRLWFPRFWHEGSLKTYKSTLVFRATNQKN